MAKTLQTCALYATQDLLCTSIILQRDLIWMHYLKIYKKVTGRIILKRTISENGLLICASRECDNSNRYNHVVAMDCNHKTNQFRMLLLHIIGMTAFNPTFTVGFRFLAMYRFENYMWAMLNLSIARYSGSVPNLIGIDRELALMNAIQQVFVVKKYFVHLTHNITFSPAARKTMKSRRSVMHYANVEHIDIFYKYIRQQ